LDFFDEKIQPARDCRPIARAFFVLGLGGLARVQQRFDIGAPEAIPAPRQPDCRYLSSLTPLVNNSCAHAKQLGKFLSRHQNRHDGFSFTLLGGQKTPCRYTPPLASDALSIS
jgi:hypothetical protein